MNPKLEAQRLRVETAAQFLRELGKGIPETERVMVSYAEDANVRTDKTGKRINSGFWPIPWKDGKYIDASKNAYACISSSIKTVNPKTGEMRYWRGESSFGHGLALMVDDIGDGVGSKGNLSLEDVKRRAAPTAIIETSPRNYQVWYFLAAPEGDMREFKAFLVSFVSSFLKAGGDNTIRDVSRYGRMPIGINNKTDEDGKMRYVLEDGKPFEVRLVEADYTKRYDISTLARAFDVAIVYPPPPRRISDDERPNVLSEMAINEYWLRLAVRVLNGSGEGSSGKVTENMSGKYRIRCPWGDAHSNGDPFGAYFRGPIAGAEVEYVFGCAHDTCRKIFKHGWGDFVEEVVMGEIYASLDRASEEFDHESYIEHLRSVGGNNE